MQASITIDGVAVVVEPGWTLLRAAQQADLYIPHLCAHPDLPPQAQASPVEAIYHGHQRIAHDPESHGVAGCGLCVVEVDGEQNLACATTVRDGAVITTTGAELTALRRARLSAILAHHPHACLTCAQREGCTREPCSMNVPVAERCCSLLGNCELQAVAEHVGIAPETRRYVPAGVDRIVDEPLFDRDPALCIACGRCVRACSSRQVEALGWVRDSDARRWVGPLDRTPVQAGCRLCGSCVEVCPTGALTDRGIKPAERDHALVPCRSACPAGTDVPRYVRLAAEGRLLEAALVVAERAPFVEVLGQVCFHPCEDACRRGEVNGAPISICRIKREAGRAAAGELFAQLPRPRSDTGHGVAVVGAGPAGIMAAHLLHLMGHSVTLFEARDALGGMLSHAIPRFRLSADVVSRETAGLTANINVRTGCAIGRDGLSVERLRQEHDAVVVATGASRSVRLTAPGTELSGVRPGLGFLEDLATGRLEPACFSGRRVVVVGGGNVAIDCARAAARLGADRVTVVCLEQPSEMPAYPSELRDAIAEGIDLQHGWGIESLEGDGALQQVKLKRCSRVFDPQGCFAPAYDEAVTRELAAEVAILALGQQPDRSLLPESLDGIFLAGDLATGPSSVVEAIASGRQAACAADRHLGGEGSLVVDLGPIDVPTALGRVEGFVGLPRLEPQSPPAPRPLGLETLAPGLGPDLARREADRCLRCDLRLLYQAPDRPPAKQTRLPLSEPGLEQVEAVEGVVRFYDATGEVLEIVGGPDMRQEVADRLDGRATTFDCEPCPMYTQRQNELLSQYMETHGRMPPGAGEDDDLDDLF